MHPASEKFPPVTELSSEDLGQIVADARLKPSALQWSAREKSAWNELANRAARKNFRP